MAANEAPKHKPSEKHTLDEVLKSLQDLIRNELLEEDRPPPPPKPPLDPSVPRKRGRPRKETPPQPPASAADSPPEDLDAVLSSLHDLLDNELADGQSSPEAATPTPEQTEPLSPEPEHAPPAPEEVTLAEAPAEATDSPAPPEEMPVPATEQAVTATEPAAIVTLPSPPTARDGQQEFLFDFAERAQARAARERHDYDFEPSAPPTDSPAGEAATAPSLTGHARSAFGSPPSPIERRARAASIGSLPSPFGRRDGDEGAGPEFVPAGRGSEGEGARGPRTRVPDVPLDTSPVGEAAAFGEQVEEITLAASPVVEAPAPGSDEIATPTDETAEIETLEPSAAPLEALLPEESFEIAAASQQQDTTAAPTDVEDIPGLAELSPAEPTTDADEFAEPPVSAPQEIPQSEPEAASPNASVEFELANDTGPAPEAPPAAPEPPAAVEADWTTGTNAVLDFDDIPVLEDVVAHPHEEPQPEPPMPAEGALTALAPQQLRQLAIRVVARLNIELRRAGERQLKAATVDRLQQVLREELESLARNVDNKSP
jgi:hypothetical protein